jgi:hypothetical protein
VYILVAIYSPFGNITVEFLYIYLYKKDMLNVEKDNSKKVLKTRKCVLAQ